MEHLERFAPGDPVIFRLEKWGTHPGPRALDVYPTPCGENYHYAVDKFWVVDRVLDDGRVVVRTRRGKTHMLDPDDPCLRRPRWFERLLYAWRFPRPDGAADHRDASAGMSAS